ncbi:LysR substrate-binding domain-containing protein [Paracidovorax citrulli]|uniref:Transcriptional regulator, LysR family n=2 Tax=Paracidovorax citrulli TaxID=80869 RepID=A1TK11_PARC0|nr:LysR substrate-binding domain-containing protein [Paracidovorax citrulli]ABM31299.1 transcriptional regulator, LysR family [Paracidovorax citrulli AAC00-1]ATG95574.1 LysR family transcriptional regulator [Paracidovorax citrulli]MVT38044.1 LysR family transcriptional regulator [Paracidovorax citrulli]PVY65489.1 LysR family glycine cleavage system transcriptional activator [Paracidovorax citrulli]REG70332.1 LysR family glycine cleavage system transcriptional activator [Paracidovorax citrulli]
MHQHIFGHIPLSALRAFEAAARLQSFKEAATELSITPTAISHRIKQLEDALGARLFAREVRSVSLTDAGQLLYPAVHTAFTGIVGAIEELQRRDRRPSVTLSTTCGFAARWLLPRLPALAAAIPNVDLHLHSSDSPVQLKAGSADLAIRFCTSPDSSVGSEVLLPGRYVPVCAPSLNVRSGGDFSNTARLRFRWSKYDECIPDWPQWLAASTMEGQPSGPELGFSDEAHTIQAAIAGQGVALSSVALVADALDEGLLRVPFGPAVEGRDFYLLSALDTCEQPAVIMVKSWLREEARAFVAKHASYFSVECPKISDTEKLP